MINEAESYSAETMYKQLTLSEIVNKNFRAAAVFEKYGLDFCCRGKVPVEKACEEKGIKAEIVFDELIRMSGEAASANIRYDEWEADFLIDYIVNNHHTYVKNMIPVLAAHTQKVAMVHGDRHPEVVEVAKKFAVVYKDLKQHLMKEEEILFPFVKQLVYSKKNKYKAEKPYFGSVNNPIKMMEAEHQAAGDEMFEIRDLTNNYTPPFDACNTYKITYKELQNFEEDLHKHVYLENYILFPKAVELERELLQAV